MSLVLTNAGEKLEITAVAIIPFTVHYADYVGATPVFTPGVASGDTINGTKDLLVAPGAGQRVVRTISVHNDSGGADTITVQLDDAGVNYTIVTVILADDYTLCYDEDGWKVLDDAGSIQTTLVGNTTQHDILSPSHGDTTTDAVTQGSITVGNATPAWDELVIGTAHQIFKVNVGGTDPAWTSFDWDDIAAGAAADMVHDHSGVNEGGLLSWDVIWTNAVHDHSAAGEGGSSIAPVQITSELLKPNQPSFSVHMNGVAQAFNAGAYVTVEFDTETWDTGADFNVGTYKFVAPLTGKYLFVVHLQLNIMDTDATLYIVRLNTSNRNYRINIDPRVFAVDAAYWPAGLTAVADMDATDEAFVEVYQAGGANITAVAGTDTETRFMGWFLG